MILCLIKYIELTILLQIVSYNPNLNTHRKLYS